MLSTPTCVCYYTSRLLRSPSERSLFSPLPSQLISSRLRPESLLPLGRLVSITSDGDARWSPMCPCYLFLQPVVANPIYCRRDVPLQSALDPLCAHPSRAATDMRPSAQHLDTLALLASRDTSYLPNACSAV
uniref:Uncharacterized protein n=1 Tax=Knipowitschia caucasica TaxID=637954 RepID=A0AAV2MDV3_KNICA